MVTIKSVTAREILDSRGTPTIESTIEDVLSGKATSKEALDKAAESITSAITEYNLSMGIK